MADHPMLASVEFGEAFQGLLDQLEETEKEQDKDLAFPKTKYTMEEAVHFESQLDRERLREIAAIVPDGPPYLQHAITRWLSDFISAHALKGGLGKGLLKGRERRAEGFVDRLKDFMQLRVLQSRKKDKNGKPVLDAKGNHVYMKQKTLATTVLRLCMKLLTLVPAPPLAPLELSKARGELRHYAKVLRTRYRLKNMTLKRRILKPIDVRTLIEDMMASEESTTDINVQFCTLLLAFLYTGSRPGGILSSRAWPAFYARWKDVRFKPVRDAEGHTMGFEVALRLVSFKGYHMHEDFAVTFRVKPTRSERFVLLDFGTFLVAHGIRQGAFGSRSLDDLLEDSRVEFGCDEESSDLPIFVARTSRSGLSVDKPLTADAATLMLQQVMRRCGISSSGAGNDTFYLLRRNFATQATDSSIGREHAKFLLGHNPNSFALEKFYDQGAQWSDLTGALLGAGDENPSVITPLAAHRAKGSLVPTKVTLKGAIERAPHIKHWSTKLEYLRQCLRVGSSEWINVEPWKSAQTSSTFSNGHLPIIIARYVHRLRSMVRQLQNNEYQSAAERGEREQQELDFEEVNRRLKMLEEPSPLAQKLIDRFMQEEQDLMNDRDAEFDAADVAEDIVVDIGDDDNDEDKADDGSDGGDSDAGSDLDGEEMDMGGPEEDPEQGSSASIAADAAMDDNFQDVEKLAKMMETTPGAAQPKVQTGNALATQKIPLLRALVGLQGYGDDILCHLCAKDSTVPPQMKSKLYKRGHSMTLRHYIIYHEAFPYGERWIKARQHEGRWYCPFDIPKTPGSDDDISQSDGEEIRQPCTFSRAVESRKPAFLKHLINRHAADLPPNLHFAFHPDTRSESEERVQQRLRAELPTINWDQDKTPTYRTTFDSLALPGAFGLQDYTPARRIALGLSAFRDGQMSMDTNEIPIEWLAEDGLLRF